MQSAIKLAAFGLLVASFSKVGNLGVHALGIGHDEEGLGPYGGLRAESVLASALSDLTNTADFSTVSTFPAIPPELTSQTLETYKRRMDTAAGTTTATVTATATVAPESGAATETDPAPTKDSLTAASQLDTSVTGAFTRTFTSYYNYTSVYPSTVVHTIVGTVGASMASANSTQAVDTSTSDFDGMSDTTTSTTTGTTTDTTTSTTTDITTGTTTGTTTDTTTGTGTFSPSVSSGFATGTDGTALYPSTTNGTWTAPGASPTGSPVVSGAMGIKMAGANIIGAAAVAAAVYLF
ncbi:hypothetical protein QBC37DRAFT_480379 [Rhypophila decipiens]|uniref:Uncharacterized protein n=1 Tax=Rhypophila decipiens TaxID=261697 RepID=A0AAN6YHB2_9PEZI|nr:hypothetical protein QBC37DRAFT_480379 [Rhypophila decipiens]